MISKQKSQRWIFRLVLGGFFEGSQLVGVVVHFAIEFAVVFNNRFPLILSEDLHSKLGCTGCFVVLFAGEQSLRQHHHQDTIVWIIDQSMPPGTDRPLVIAGFECRLADLCKFGSTRQPRDSGNLRVGTRELRFGSPIVDCRICQRNAHRSNIRRGDDPGC